MAAISSYMFTQPNPNKREKEEDQNLSDENRP